MSKVYGLIFTNSNPQSAPAISLAPTLVTFFQIGGSTLAAPGITKPIPTVGLYTFTYDPGLTLPVYFLADGGTLITDDTQRYLSGFLDPIQQVDQQAQTLTAIGASNIALGTTNVAIGTTNFALGTTSVALGITNVALGTSNIALGTTNVAIGSSNIALGTTNVAIGTSNIALGMTNVALGTSITAQAATITAYSVSLSAISASIYAGIEGISLNVVDILARIGQTTSAIGTTSTDPGDLYGFLKRLQEYNEGNQNFAKTTGVWQIETRGGTLFVQKTLSNTSTEVDRS